MYERVSTGTGVLEEDVEDRSLLSLWSLYGVCWPRWVGVELFYINIGDP